MRLRSLALLLVPGAALACGGDSSDPVGQPAAKPAVRAETAPKAPEPEADGVRGWPGCPDGTDRTQLEFSVIDTVMTWCVRTGAEEQRVQHGPWEKRRAGNVVEVGEYRDGLRHGQWTRLWESGNRQSRGEYREGRKAGPWTFWNEAGDVLRSVDYGDPSAPSETQTAAAEEPEPEPPAEQTQVSLLLENSHASDLIFALEPWAEEYTMAPGDTVQVSAVGPPPGDLVVESSEDAIVVWAWEGSEVELLFDGEVALP